MFRDYQNYDVLEDGKIWSKVSKKFLKPSTTRDGYQKVCLVDNNGKKHMQYVHRVIYEAVTGKPIPKGMQINHKNESKTTNAIWNLELVTPKDNNNWGSHNERSAASRSKRVGAFKNGEIVMVFPSTNDAHRNGYNKGNISECCRNCYLREGNNVYKGYVWKYLDD